MNKYKKRIWLQQDLKTTADFRENYDFKLKCDVLDLQSPSIHHFNNTLNKQNLLI